MVPRMNTYSHRAHQYPYAKDDAPHYTPGSYSFNPVSHPVPAMGTASSNPQFHPSAKYGSRHAHHEPPKYGASYEKEVPPHMDYGHVGWSSAPPDAPPDYYPMNVPSANSRPYRSDLKLDSYPPHFKADQLSQNSWDNPALNQYSNVRLAIFVENCNCAYELVESDLRELFSYYSGVHCLSISPDYPAAELIVTDPSACSVASSELNGIVLQGIGTLRCVVMRPGQTLSSVLYNANLYQSKAPSASSTTADSASSRYQYPDHGHKAGAGLAVPPSPPPAKDYVRPLNANGVEHVAGITNKPSTKRMARFELVELFSFEPDFDVTNSILGPNNANIEYIMKNANNKVDISIKGKPLNSAPVSDRLHISITSTDFFGYNKAVFMIEDLLSSVCEKYVEYVKERGKIVSNLVGFRRHEYEEDATGVLDYKGFADKPKTWLDQSSRRFYKSGYRGAFSKKVSDRSRPITGSARPPTARMASGSRSRSVRK